LASYPPLEGEGRLIWSAAKYETGWGDSLSTDTVPEWRDHPTPLALRAIDPPPPGEGKRNYIRCIDTDTFGPFLMV
jgi:hypothetical protein